MIKDLQNKLKQAEESKERFKLRRKQFNEKRLNRDASTTESQPPKKKVAVIVNDKLPVARNDKPSVALVARATGHMLRTGPVSSDSGEESDSPERERVNMIRIPSQTQVSAGSMEPDHPQSQLRPSQQADESQVRIGFPDEAHLEKTGRDYAISLSRMPGTQWHIVKPIPGEHGYDSDDELPDLEFNSDEAFDHHDLGPHLTNMIYIEKGIGKCKHTIQKDTRIILKNGINYAWIDGCYVSVTACKRGPARPDQKILHLHANFPYCLEYAEDIVKSWENFCQNETYNRFRVETLMLKAGICFNYEARKSKDRVHKIGEIICGKFPDLQPCPIYATAQEAIDFADAQDLVRGNGWMVHFAQQLQRIHANMVIKMVMPYQAENHAILMIDDLNYWFQQYRRESRITRWYSRQIELIESVQAGNMEFCEALRLSAETRRQFNSETGSFWFPSMTMEEISRLRFFATGIPNQFADIFLCESAIPSIPSMVQWPS
jgi:hypothetical protein